MEHEVINKLFLELSQYAEAKTAREIVLENALRALYFQTKDYIEINHLGDVHHNQVMKNARDALNPP